MNQFLKSFVDNCFRLHGKALDLGAGELVDVKGIEQMGWACEEVDIKTGTDLEQPYLSQNGPFDLVFSNFVIHKLDNKEQLIKTAFDNLKTGGRLFLQTFDVSDRWGKDDVSRLSQTEITDMLTRAGFRNIETKVFDFYDDKESHKHWHKILQATAQK